MHRPTKPCRRRGASRALFLTAALAIGAIGISACSESGGDEAVPAETGPDRDEPGVYQVGPNEYVVTVLAYEAGFNPSEIRVPAGATVTFRVRAADEQWVHGFLIEGTPIELEVDSYEYYEGVHTFEQPGEYTFVCHLYCGGGHPSMLGTVIVE